jgi:hypothetical protein
MQLVFGIKVWAAVVEAIGHGQQILMVRSDRAKSLPLLLHPTFSYWKTPLDDKFQPQFVEMARTVGQQAMEEAHQETLVTMKYCAVITDNLPIDRKMDWSALEPYFIWKQEHVTAYVRTRATSSIWLVRAYHLPKAITTPAKRHSGSLTSYLHHETVNAGDPSPVLNDEKYNELRASIISNLPLSMQRQKAVLKKSHHQF